MTKTELAKYKKFLEDRLAELSEVVRNREGIAIEKNADALDEVQHAAERELAIRNLDRESHMLRNVRGALRRMNEGAFGICVRCEEEINPKRLSAVPWTPFCITCQEWADQQQGHEDQFDMFENEPAMVA
jgi:DnaK suppressor protein